MVLSPYYISNIIKPDIYVDDNLTTKFVELVYKDDHQRRQKYRKATKKYVKMNTPAPKNVSESSEEMRKEASWYYPPIPK